MPWVHPCRFPWAHRLGNLLWTLMRGYNGLWSNRQFWLLFLNKEVQKCGLMLVWTGLIDSRRMDHNHIRLWRCCDSSRRLVILETSEHLVQATYGKRVHSRSIPSCVQRAWDSCCLNRLRSAELPFARSCSILRCFIFYTVFVVNKCWCDSGSVCFFLTIITIVKVILCLRCCLH